MRRKAGRAIATTQLDQRLQIISQRTRVLSPVSTVSHLFSGKIELHDPPGFWQIKEH
jgi:hypothetical protein